MTEKAHFADEPFSYRQIKEGRVQIFHEGRLVKALRGKEAAKFLTKLLSVEAKVQQLIMAKKTGAFKFGNERVAQQKSQH